MRFDGFGMFWQDTPPERGKRESGPRPMPPIPETGWTAPTEFPNLAAAKVLAIDTETYDPNLLERGPGWPTGDGHVVGISVGTDDGHRWYFPMRHEVGGGNLDPDAVLRWARDELTRSTQPKVGANLQYDVGWLRYEGVHVQGKLIDVQFAEPLLDEYRRTYSLDSLAQTYLGEHKVDEELYDWLHRAYGGKPGRRQAGNIYRSPVALAGPYAEGDVDLPLRIWERQQELLEEQGLIDLFRMECDLIYMLVDMRMRGVRVDVEAAERANEALQIREAELDKKLGGINVDTTADLQRAFDREGVSYPRTAKGNASFAKDFLEACNHPLAKVILEKRHVSKARGTFIQGYVLDKAVNGRLHCEFHPLRSDDSGTVSGRFSSSNPNLQNIPARDLKMKRWIRGLFIPEDGETWLSIDYSQIEYRLMVHAAVGPGAEEARERYRSDPKTDYHEFTQLLIQDLLGREIGRKPTKGVNFGKIFGMGKAKLIATLPGLTRAEAEAFFKAYEDAIPYSKTTLDRASKAAQRRGYIKTILGRRARFPFWEPGKYYSPEEKAEKLREDPTFFDMQRDRDQALAKWGRNIKRARTHKALNAYTQGGGADLIKRAMLDIYSAGMALPLITVHDELNWSIPTEELVKQTKELKEVMEQAVKLKVPILADAKAGPNWGELK